MIKLMVVDFIISIQGILSFLINYNSIKIVAATSRPDRIFDLLEKSTPDVIMIDVSLKDLQDFKILKQIRNRCPNLKILVFTGFDRKVIIRDCFYAGAHGYVVKTINSKQLAFAIGKVYSGEFDFFYRKFPNDLNKPFRPTDKKTSKRIDEELARLNLFS